MGALPLSMVLPQRGKLAPPSNIPIPSGKLHCLVPRPRRVVIPLRAYPKTATVLYMFYVDYTHVWPRKRGERYVSRDGVPNAN